MPWDDLKEGDVVAWESFDGRTLRGRVSNLTIHHDLSRTLVVDQETPAGLKLRFLREENAEWPYGLRRWSLQSDPVNSPDHYKQVPGIECYEVVRHFPFLKGNAIKYIWRSAHKGNEVGDLKKAIRCLELELKKHEGK